MMTLSVPSVGSGRRGSAEVRLVLSLMNKRQTHQGTLTIIILLVISAIEKVSPAC